MGSHHCLDAHFSTESQYMQHRPVFSWHSSPHNNYSARRFFIVIFHFIFFSKLDQSEGRKENVTVNRLWNQSISHSAVKYSGDSMLRNSFGWGSKSYFGERMTSSTVCLFWIGISITLQYEPHFLGWISDGLAKIESPVLFCAISCQRTCTVYWITHPSNFVLKSINESDVFTLTWESLTQPTADRLDLRVRPDRTEPERNGTLTPMKNEREPTANHVTVLVASKCYKYATIPITRKAPRDQRLALNFFIFLSPFQPCRAALPRFLDTIFPTRLRSYQHCWLLSGARYMSSSQVCKCLARMIGAGSWPEITWGIAGRSKAKLEEKVL